MADHLQQTLANPAPLGLFGFGMSTILLSIHNAGLSGLSATIMTTALFYGGLAQIIAGILEYKRGNTFGVVVFSSYGVFWLTLVGVWLASSWGMPPADPISLGYYLLIWAVFTAGLFIGTRKGPLLPQLTFGSATIVFTLLALVNFTGSAILLSLAGYGGLVCGGLAFYSAMAVTVNEARGTAILPLC